MTKKLCFYIRLIMLILLNKETKWAATKKLTLDVKLAYLYLV